MIVTPGSTTASCRTCVCLMAALCVPVVSEHFYILLTLIKSVVFVNGWNIGALYKF